MKKDNNKSVISLSMIIQFILSIIIMVLFIVWIFGNKSIINYIWLFIGVDLIVTGYNNNLFYKRYGLTIYYYVVGLLCILYAVLKIVGVL